MAQMIVSGIALGAIYGLVALGIVLVHKATGVLNFAHGEMVMVTTFVALSFLTFGLPYWLVVVFTLIFAAIFGLAVETFLIRKLIGAPLLTTALTCLGLFLILGDVAVWIWGKDPHMFPSVFSETPFIIGGIKISPADLGPIIVCAVLSLALYLFFKFTKVGIAMQATIDNQTAARLMGIPVQRMFAISWILATVVKGVKSPFD